MTDKKLEKDDPFELVGVELPNQSEAQLKDMACCFVEEFAKDGWSEEQLVEMFKNPMYQGPHLVWQQKGETFCRSVVKEVLAMWRPERTEA